MAKIDDSVKKKVPELRFKGFTDELLLMVECNSINLIKKESSIDLRQFTSKKGNTVYVDVDGQKVIKSAFLFFSSFSQSFRASFGRKKTPEKIGCDCKIKKVPRKRHLYYNIYFWLFHNQF